MVSGIDDFQSLAIHLLHADRSESRLVETPNVHFANRCADDPLVPEIAHVYKTERARYEATAREW